MLSRRRCARGFGSRCALLMWACLLCFNDLYEHLSYVSYCMQHHAWNDSTKPMHYKHLLHCSLNIWGRIKGNRERKWTKRPSIRKQTSLRSSGIGGIRPSSSSVWWTTVEVFSNEKCSLLFSKGKSFPPHSFQPSHCLSHTDGELLSSVTHLGILQGHVVVRGKRRCVYLSVHLHVCI